MINLDVRVREFLTQNLPYGYKVQEILQDASLRKYYRIAVGDKMCVLMDCPPSYTSILPFLNIANYLKSIQISAPSVHAHNVDSGLILMEDFGDVSFNKLLNTGVDEVEIYKLLIDALIQIQESELTISLEIYDNAIKTRELGVFCKWYWQHATGASMSDEMKVEFLGIVEKALNKIPTVGKDVFVHKDFHVDNLILINGKSNIDSVGVLDFQDALVGNCAGDIGMLLDDARRFVFPDLRNKMIEYYCANRGIDRQGFLTAYNIISAQCNMRILGVFARKLILDQNDLYAKKYMSHTMSYLVDNLRSDVLSDVYAYLAHRISF